MLSQQRIVPHYLLGNGSSNVVMIFLHDYPDSYRIFDQ